MEYNKNLILDEYKRIYGVQENEYVRSSFGPDNTFFIRREDGKLILYVCEWFLHKVKSRHDISTVQLFYDFLVQYPRYYAENVFSKALIHYGNYVDFIKNFKIVTDKVLNIGERYYEEKFIAK